jgi:hypothetical protein
LSGWNRQRGKTEETTTRAAGRARAGTARAEPKRGQIPTRRRLALVSRHWRVLQGLAWIGLGQVERRRQRQDRQHERDRHHEERWISPAPIPFTVDHGFAILLVPLITTLIGARPRSRASA